MDITIRPATGADSEACGRVAYEGFRSVNERHAFPTNYPSVEAATRRVRILIDHPRVYGVVAEADGRTVGFCFLSERDPIRAVGPMVVDPAMHTRGIGRRLMAAVLERARGAPSVRLLQETYNMQSLALYASFGFEVKELLIVMAGTPTGSPMDGWEVRRLEERDLAESTTLYERVHGFPRTNELRDAIAMGSPIAALRSGRMTAYLAVPTFWIASHGVAESQEDVQALLLGARRITEEPLSFLLPTQDASLFRWCLAEGFRAIKPMSLMVIGEYQEPRGSYFPSVLY
jgi:GNAT superfamily N-acetyltransferase